jgi:membrane-associated phospholipid phosphatase
VAEASPIDCPSTAWRGTAAKHVFTLCALIGAGLLALAVDLPLSRWLVLDKPSEGLHRILETIEPFGQPVAVFVTAAAIALCDAKRRRAVPRLLAAALGAGLSADVLKILLARSRPYHHDLTGSIWDTFHGLLPGLHVGSRLQSFPSAHTATAVGFCLGMGTLYPAGRRLFGLVAALVALHRVEVGAHFLSDILWGSAVGYAVCLILHGPTAIGRWFDALERSTGAKLAPSAANRSTPGVSPARAGVRSFIPSMSESLRLATPGVPRSLSIIVPLYNERESLVWLHAALRAVLEKLDLECETIFVDDGSTDGSNLELEEIAARDARVRIVTLAENRGQSVALRAGITHARGEALVLIDADLQNDPADIPAMLARFAEGYDLVHGWRRNRQDRWLDRRLPSYAANRLISWVSGYRAHDTGCTLKILRRELAQSLPLFGGMHRYIPALSFALGARCVEVDTRHHPRRFGSSKYGLSRIARVLTELVLVKFLSIALRRQREALAEVGSAEGDAPLLRVAQASHLRRARAG